VPLKDLAKRREYDRAYRQRPEVKARKNARSRQRYATDPAFRERELCRAAEYRMNPANGNYLRLMGRDRDRLRYAERSSDEAFMERRRENQRRSRARAKARLLESKARLDALLAEQAGASLRRTNDIV
jgi:hypothetical protein